MFPEALVNSPLFGIGLTVIVYCMCEVIVARLKFNIIPPFVLACPIILLLILYTPDLKYEQYAAGADFINFLLGPATIALALPLVRNKNIIKQHFAVIIGGITIATLTAIISIFLAATILGASEKVLISLIPKSVTTPIALEVSTTIGGIPPLTAAAVIFTGMLGATFNHKILNLLGIKNNLAAGLAIGASSHGLGTSVCAAVNPVQLATGGVAIALTGIATSILTPILLPVLKTLFN